MKILNRSMLLVNDLLLFFLSPYILVIYSTNLRRLFTVCNSSFAWFFDPKHDLTKLKPLFLLSLWDFI
jgi:hypothetical protein